MRLITLNEAFSNESISHLEDALFDLNKKGVVDDLFLPTAKKHLTSFEGIRNACSLEPIKETKKKITIQ